MFNLIHLSTSFKIDIFILKNRPFDISSMNRAALEKLDLESDLKFPIASPKDTILSKLERYRLGNEVSERQWEDVTRVMRILGPQANLNYLKSNAAVLNLSDLLQKLINSVSRKVAFKDASNLPRIRTGVAFDSPSNSLPLSFALLDVQELSKSFCGKVVPRAMASLLSRPCTPFSRHYLGFVGWRAAK